MQYQFILNEVAGRSTLTVVIGGVPTQIDDTHPAFEQIVDGLGVLSSAEMRELLDSNKRVRKALAQFGNVKVENDVVTYKGEVVNGLLATRMINMLESGLDIRPWALFLENLQQNPAKHAVDELFLWLERSGMPITDRGNFIAYKKVADDYTSYHNNPDGSKFRNDIGTMVTMPRNRVCDDRSRTCSQGLHFCSWDYLPHYMGNRGRVILLEVNPAHVVSIPSDYNNAKGRAEGYLIVGEIAEADAPHAFPGMDYVSDDNEYFSYDWDDTDFSSIDDGWFNDSMAEFESDGEDEYELGYSIGFQVGLVDAPYDMDAELHLQELANTYLEDSFADGYADGFYAGAADRDFSEQEVAAYESACETDEAYGFVRAPERRSFPSEWTYTTVVADIEAGFITPLEFVQGYLPDEFDIYEVMTRVTNKA